MSKWLSGLALILSALALAVSIWTYQQADARAEAALKRREKALVEKHRPDIERLCREFGLKEGPPPGAETLNELMDPLGRLLETLSK
jgi:hypothetical protein